MNVFFISLCLYGCLCVSLFVCVWQFHFCNYSAYKLTYIKLSSIWFRFMSHFVLDLKKKKNKNRKYIWFASHFFQLSCKLQFIKDWSLSRYQIFGLNFIKMISKKKQFFHLFEDCERSQINSNMKPFLQLRKVTMFEREASIMDGKNVLRFTTYNYIQ